MNAIRPKNKMREKCSSEKPRSWVITSLTGVLSLLVTGVQGQVLSEDAASKRFITLVPRLTVSETWTNNVRVSSSGSGEQRDQVMEVSPGLVVQGDSARLKGYLDYALNKIHYSSNTASDKFQKSLNAFGTLEIAENFMFIDVGGHISQQSTSALGTHSAVDTLINDNQTEVSNYRISPSIKGQISDIAHYEARWSRSIMGSQTPLRSSIGQTDVRLKLSGNTALKGLSWSADSSRQSVGFSAGRTTEADQHLLGLAYALTDQLSLNAQAGVESSNYSSLEKEKFQSRGGGFNWHLSNRTALSGSLEKKSFGHTHRLDFEHRTGRTAWKLSDSKNSTSTPNQPVLGSVGSIYDILFSQFATLEPNALARAQLVNAYLQINNLSPATRVFTPFLASAQTISRQQELLCSLLGIRSTVTLIAAQTRSQRLDSLSSAVDDFSTVSTIQQQGVSINYAHRLSPDMTLGALVSWQKSGGVHSDMGESTNLLSMNLTHSLAKNSTVSAAFRQVSYRRALAPSRESALTININLLF